MVVVLVWSPVKLTTPTGEIGARTVELLDAPVAPPPSAVC